jgi:hypothetical protein
MRLPTLLVAFSTLQLQQGHQRTRNLKRICSYRPTTRFLVSRHTDTSAAVELDAGVHSLTIHAPYFSGMRSPTIHTPPIYLQ